MGNNSSTDEYFANGMYGPMAISEEILNDRTVLALEDAADSESEIDMEAFIKRVQQLRLRVRCLHLSACEHYRRLEIGIPPFRRMLLSKEGTKIRCGALHSSD